MSDDGIKINLSASDVKELVAAMRETKERKAAKLKELGIPADIAAQDDHCGVVVCGG